MTDDKIKEDLSKHSNYVLGEKIGEGSQGEIFIAQLNDLRYAVKVFPYALGTQNIIIGRNNDGLSEINFTRLLRHPYIIESTDFVMGDHNLFLILELADYDLAHYLLKYNLNFKDKLRLIFQIGSALDYLQRSGFVHCDVHTHNVLIKNGNVLLSDFGFTNIRDLDCHQSQAPESYYSIMACNRTYDNYHYVRNFGEDIIEIWQKNAAASEIWTYGVICLEIIYNIPDITGDNKLNDLGYESYLSFLEYLSQNYTTKSLDEIITGIFGQIDGPEKLLLHLICGMLLEFNQDKRIKTYDEFLSNPIFKDYGLIQANLNTFNYTSVNGEIMCCETIDKIVSYMFEVANISRLPSLIILNAVDFFLQKMYKYIYTDTELVLFSMTCLWLMCDIFRYRKITVRTCLQFANSAMRKIFHVNHDYYNSKDVYNKIKYIIKMENGVLLYESLYFYLPSMELIKTGAKITRNCIQYNELGGPNGIARYLIKNESSEEFSKRTHKTGAYIEL